MIETVFLDIDGVLSNFNKRAFEALGLEYDRAHPALKKWDWYKYFNITFEELDSVCTIDFWAGLQWQPDGLEILKLVESAGREIYLITTPMPNPGSWTGKRLWVERHLPEYSKRLIITESSKSILASSDRLLIDDNDKNIIKFHEAGGYSILVPRSWNRARNDGPTVPIVRGGLSSLLGRAL